MSAASGTLGLFLYAGDIGATSADIPVFLQGAPSGTNGFFGGLELLVEGEGRKQGQLNLFVQGPDSDWMTAQLNLYTEGRHHTAQASLPLYVGTSGVSQALPLFIRGLGVTPGALPAQESLNLFLARRPTGTLALYLRGPGEEWSEDVPLFIQGAELLASGLDLSLPHVTAVLAGSVKLYIGGF